METRAETLPFATWVSLVPHRVLGLRSGALAVLAERSTGWCLVDADGYRVLRDRIGMRGCPRHLLPDASGGVLDQLWQAGLLVVDGRPHPDTIVRPDPTPSSLLLKLTGACNLDCTYCYDYEVERFQARLDFDRIRSTVADLLARRETLSLVFHGGEPLLRFDLLQRIVADAERQAGDPLRLRFAIQTNAALLSDEIVRFFEAHRFSVGISLDGIDEESNRLRPTHRGGSSLGIVRGMLERYGDFVREHCGVLAVASRSSAAQMPRFACWLQSEGIRSLTVTFLDLAGRGIDLASEKLTPPEAVALYAQLVALVRSGDIERLALRSLTSRIDNLFTFQPRDFCHRGPCAAGSEFLVLDAQGGFRTCDCVYHPYFELGDRTTDVAGTIEHPARRAIAERHSWLREHGADCATCPLFGLCGGTCVAKAIANHGTPRSVDPTECALVRWLYPELLDEFSRDGEGPLFRYYRRHRLPGGDLP